MSSLNDITLAEIESLRESVRKAHRAFGSWRVVGRRLLGMSGAYALRIATEPTFMPTAAVIYHWREFWQVLPDAPWKTTPKLMEQAWEIIKDRWGPQNAIYADKLAYKLKIIPRRARATVSALCKEGYPICSLRAKNGGYFRPESLEEYRKYRNRYVLGPATDALERVRAQEEHELEWFPAEDKNVMLIGEGIEQFRLAI